MPVSTTFKQAAYAPETGEAFLVLVTIDHPDLAVPIRVTSDAVSTYRRISNTVVDSSATGNDATLAGAPIFKPGPIAGSALRFAATADRGTIPDHAAYSGLVNATVEFWFRLIDRGTSAFPDIVGKQTGVADRMFFFHLDDPPRPLNLTWRHSDGTAQFGATFVDPVEVGRAYHIALTKQGDEFVAYLDGSQVGSLTITGATTGNSAPWFINQNDDATFEIDDLRIWNVARTAQEIADNKDAPLAGTETGLVGYWRFDDGQEFVSLPFRVTLPDETEESARSRLEIDNVHRDIVKAIRALTSPPTVTLEGVLASAPDIVEAGPFDFELEEAKYDVLVVRGELAFEPILDLAVPADVMSPGLFPGLFT